MGDDTSGFWRGGSHTPFLGRSGAQALDSVIIVCRVIPDSNEKSEVDREIDAHTPVLDLLIFPYAYIPALDTIHRFLFRSLSRHVTPCSSSFPRSSLF